MAELLIMAKTHWMDSPTYQVPTEATALQQYQARSQKGDVIVVRPDGWQWGNEETLPNFILVKVPGLSATTAKQYEDRIEIDGDPPVLLRRRKWHIPVNYVNQVIAAGGTVTITNQFLLNRIEAKTV